MLYILLYFTVSGRMLATLTDSGEEAGNGGRSEEVVGGQVHSFIRVFMFLLDKLIPSSPSTCTQGKR